jgi:hypothetical protein
VIDGKIDEKRVLKERGKQRECLIKGVAKKKLTSKSKKDCSCWDSKLCLGCAIQNTVLNVFLYENTAYIRRTIRRTIPY